MVNFGDVSGRWHQLSGAHGVRGLPPLVREVKRLLAEAPFRSFVRLALMPLPTSVRTKALWEIGERPHCLLGVLSAADQATREGVEEIAVAEFGVAGGNGLVALQYWAGAVERETAVRISVFGFDTGAGLPETCGDYRDHPDKWAARDFPMDVDALRRRLEPSTELILGDTRESVPAFAQRLRCPIGFASIDVDLYSSATAVLRLFSGPRRKMLRRTYLYFDDIADPQASFFHRFAGELLAIEEFKLDQWRGLRGGRIFHESAWIEKMYVAHDLQAINESRPDRAPLGDFRLEEALVRGRR